MRHSPRRKYGNQKIILDGQKFDSKKEANYYAELVIRKAARDIADFQTQVKFILQPAFRDATGRHHRAITWTADFLIQHTDGTTEVVEIKGFPNDRWPMKMKMFLYHFPQHRLTVIGEAKKKSRGME